MNRHGVKMRVKQFNKNIPAYHHEEGNAGYDLFADLPRPYTVQPGEVVLIPLNIATELPSGVVGLLFQRSSTFNKWGLRLMNSVGVIDPSFSGDGDRWCAQFRNETRQPKTVNPGDKICQAVFVSFIEPEIEIVDKFDNEDRGGFGTTFDNASELKGGN